MRQVNARRRSFDSPAGTHQSWQGAGWVIPFQSRVGLGWFDFSQYWWSVELSWLFSVLRVPPWWGQHQLGALVKTSTSFISFNVVFSIKINLCYLKNSCKYCFWKIRNQSIKETAEEILIWDCVKVDTEKFVTTCDYPFTTDPETYLTRKWGGVKNNFKMAERTLNTQRAKSEESRSNVVKFNNELYSKGFVSPVSELSPELQKLISDATFVHYFCWRSVWQFCIIKSINQSMHCSQNGWLMHLFCSNCNT